MMKSPIFVLLMISLMIFFVWPRNRTDSSLWVATEPMQSKANVLSSHHLWAARFPQRSLFLKVKNHRTPIRPLHVLPSRQPLQGEAAPFSLLGLGTLFSIVSVASWATHRQFYNHYPLSPLKPLMAGTAKSINPATGETIAEYNYISDEAAADAAGAAHAAFLKWRTLPVADRTAPLIKAAAILRTQQNELAELMAREMGKCVREGRAEVEKCAKACEHYANNIERYMEPEFIETEYSKSYVVLQPLGVILIVMPWNFPLWQVFRQAASGLSAGNTILLKHASNVFGCATAIQHIMDEAGFPPGVFTNLVLSGRQCSTLLAHPRVRGVALTGSTPVGKELGAQAGRLLKKAVLELGGADSYIILEDADVAAAAKACAAGRILNCGQSCIGAKRFIVLDAIYDAFLEAFVNAIAATVVGDPLDDMTTMGPMVGVKAREELHRQVTASVEAGAKVALGGEPMDGPEGSAYYTPTILTDVQPGMPAYDEELFGPVAAVIRVPDEAAAVEAANATPFGLGSAVFTQDIERGERLAVEGLEAGLAFVNDFVKSDPRLPFGGTKESGLGRECSHHGVREFCNTKTVVVR